MLGSVQNNAVTAILEPGARPVRVASGQLAALAFGGAQLQQLQELQVGLVVLHLRFALWAAWTCAALCCTLCDWLIVVAHCFFWWQCICECWQFFCQVVCPCGPPVACCAVRRPRVLPGCVGLRFVWRLAVGQQAFAKVGKSGTQSVCRS